jgi:zinc/manganese transport system substrate-binding protein
VEYHRAWVYLAKRFGMEILGRVEPLPGIPPSARDLARLADLIRRHGSLAVVREAYQAESSVEFLERETGARGVVLSASCAEPTPEAYLATFDRAAELLGHAGGPADGSAGAAAGDAR